MKAISQFKFIIWGFCLLSAVIWFGCEIEEIGPIEKNTTPPGNISEVTVENLNGKAKLTYTLPKEENLLYVKAVYELNSGETREVKSSYYNNSLIVDGFGDTLQHEVKLYAVNRGELESEPVTVTVQPKMPPVNLIFETLQVRETFGGVNIKALNEFEENVAIDVLVRDSINRNEWVKYDAIYTGAPDLDRSLRGIDTVSQEFAFYVRDRWFNSSDTLVTEIKPLYEAKLDKGLWREVNLPGDMIMNKWSRAMWMLWDEGYSGWGSTACSDDNPSGDPYWFTFDMGKASKLSRFKFWLYREGNNTACNYYCGWAPIEFELWGSNDPDPDGGWNNWEKLEHCMVQKPSQLSYGKETGEDREVAASGVEFEIPLEASEVRYIRMKIIHNAETYAGVASNNGIVLSEISAWGQPVQ